MSVSERIVQGIIGKSGRHECSPCWHREISAESPAVGGAFVTLDRVVFEYDHSFLVVEDGSDVVDKILSRELERLLRHALNLRRYSRVDGMNVRATMDKPFEVLKGGKGYGCRLRRIEYDYGWRVAPSQEAWDAGVEAEKEEERRKEAEREEKRRAANARRRERAAAKRAEKRAREEAADPRPKRLFE